MPASQTARGGVLAAAVVLFVTGAIALAFVSGSGGPSRATNPGPVAVPTTVAATTPSSASPATTASSASPATTASSATTVAPASSPSTAPVNPPTTASGGSQHLAHTGLDGNVAFLAVVAMIAGVLIIWVEERTRLLAATARAGAGRGRARAAAYQPRHSARRPARRR